MICVSLTLSVFGKFQHCFLQDVAPLPRLKSLSLLISLYLDQAVQFLIAGTCWSPVPLPSTWFSKWNSKAVSTHTSDPSSSQLIRKNTQTSVEPELRFHQSFLVCLFFLLDLDISQNRCIFTLLNSKIPPSDNRLLRFDFGNPCFTEWCSSYRKHALEQLRDGKKKVSSHFYMSNFV